MQVTTSEVIETTIKAYEESLARLEKAANEVKLVLIEMMNNERE